MNHQWPVNVPFVFVAKHFNAGKIDSIFWLFKGLYPYIAPEYIMFLDIGTICREKAIFNFTFYMDTYPKTGGVTGELEVFFDDEFTKAKGLVNVLFAWFLTMVQDFEYRYTCYIDRLWDSVLGYTSILPGAFSMLRWEAIKGEPIVKLFSTFAKPHKTTPFKENMILAEDGVMCYYIILEGYYLRYIPDSIAMTDPPGDVVSFLK